MIGTILKPNISFKENHYAILLIEAILYALVCGLCTTKNPNDGLDCVLNHTVLCCQQTFKKICWYHCGTYLKNYVKQTTDIPVIKTTLNSSVYQYNNGTCIAKYKLMSLHYLHLYSEDSLCGKLFWHL